VTGNRSLDASSGRGRIKEQSVHIIVRIHNERGCGGR